MKNKLLLVAMLLMTTAAIGQISSTNGYRLQTTDTLKIFMVFAESLDDPLDTYTISPTDPWQRGFMPSDANDYLDYKFTNAASINGWLTKYFYQASFGQFFVLGDYYPNLVQLDYATMTGYGDNDVLDVLNALPGTDINTAHNLTINSDAFDKVISPAIGAEGMPKIISTDGNIDLMMILWRVNEHVTTSTYGGTFSTYGSGEDLKSKTGFMAFSRFVGNWGAAYYIMKHEMSHGLFGGNDFHNGGSGHGARTFLSNVGGYAILSSDNRISPTFNAWDRRRLGWIYPGSPGAIKAINTATSTEVETDFEYNEIFPAGSNGEFILRDFVTYGDAIRIKLPYLQADGATVRDQWLWIENHQNVAGNIDMNSSTTKGMYAYIQVGKEDLTTFDLGPNNFTYPLVKFGNWDYEFDPIATTLNAVTGKENPLSGYHHLSLPAYDLNNDDQIKRGETTYITDLLYNGVSLDDLAFNFEHYPVYGTDNDAFVALDKISIAKNPTASSILTYQTKEGDDADAYASRQTTDNGVIRLNGISIEVLEQEADGDIRVKIRWDDFDVSENVRWCGNIALHDKLYPKSTAVITVDRGLSPTKPTSPATFMGQEIFSDPTILTLRSGSETIMDIPHKLTPLLRGKLTLPLPAGRPSKMDWQVPT